ncbi:MAG: hypothetical protein Q9183_004159 [Haloplaca sp. 2 TL-2023]
MDPGTAIAVTTLSSKVLSIIWKYSSDVKNAKSDIISLRDEIQTFDDVLKSVQDVLKKSPRLTLPASLRTALDQAQKDLESLENQLDPGKKAKWMSRVGKRALTWPLAKKEVESWIARFQRLKATINLALDAGSASDAPSCSQSS